MSLPDRPGGQGSKPRRDAEEGRERLTPDEHRLCERLEAWARQSPHRGNAFAITATAFLMVWLLAGIRDLPERDPMRLGIGLMLERDDFRFEHSPRSRSSWRIRAG